MPGHRVGWLVAFILATDAAFAVLVDRRFNLRHHDTTQLLGGARHWPTPTGAGSVWAGRAAVVRQRGDCG